VTRALGIAVAGLGNAGIEHARAFAAHPDAAVVALVDADPVRAASACEALGLEPTAIASYEAAIADPRVDAVVVATPNALHAEMTIAAAAAGKHVLLEKPAALDAASLAQMVDAVGAAGVVCHVDMVLRWHPLIESIVRLRDGGALGEVFAVEADFVFGELEGPEPDWARTVRGGGSLHLYAGCHAYDQLQWLAGDRIVEVSAVSTRRSPAWQYDVTASVLARFSRGAIGRATVTLEARAPYRFGVRVLGTRGTVVDDELCMPEETGATYRRHCDRRVDVSYLPFDRAADDFLHSVRTGQPSHAALERTADVFLLALDIERAARDRVVVAR
jgi:predicted dehydrogenase